MANSGFPKVYTYKMDAVKKCLDSCYAALEIYLYELMTLELQFKAAQTFNCQLQKYILENRDEFFACPCTDIEPFLSTLNVEALFSDNGRNTLTITAANFITFLFLNGEIVDPYFIEDVRRNKRLVTDRATYTASVKGFNKVHFVDPLKPPMKKITTRRLRFD